MTALKRTTADPDSKTAKRMALADKKLSKDLDVVTYIRSVQKVRGLVQCLLDDKQRIMLKYGKHRSISLNDKPIERKIAEGQESSACVF